MGYRSIEWRVGVSPARLALVLAGVLAWVAVVALTVPAPADAKRNLYSTNLSSMNIGAFDIAAGGQLSPITGSPFSTGSNPNSPAITPDGSYLYVPNLDGGNLTGYQVNSATGALQTLGSGPYPAGNKPFGSAITPDGSYLFVSNEGTPDTISRFSIGGNGNLTDLGTDTPTSSSPRGIAITPDGKYLYVANADANGVSAYSIGAGGSLSALADSPFSTGLLPQVVSITPDGKYLYVVNASSETVSAYSIGADGKLTELPDSPFSSPGEPFGGVAITPDGSYLYVSGSADDQILRYSIGVDGKLTTLAPPAAAATFPTGLAVTPDGKRLYAANTTSSNISAYTIGGNGSLSSIGAPTASGGTFPNFQPLAITPNQPPTASIAAATAARATSATVGKPVNFDASGSADPDGTIAGYAWNFGDGTLAVRSNPTISHTYSAPGTYTVRLTLTDNEGCSTERVYSSRIVSCNGSVVATTTEQVTVAAAPPDTEVTGAKISAKRKQKARGRIKLKIKGGADEAVKGVATGKVKRYKLKKVKKSSSAGKRKTYKLKLKRKKDDRKIRKLLKRGKKVKAKLTLKLTDGAGNTYKRTKKVKLKR